MDKKQLIRIILLIVVVALSFSGIFLWNQLEPEPVEDIDIPESTSTESTTESPVFPSRLLRHAPNIYVQWFSENGEFDAVTIDWKCTEDAWSTYWAVHQWSYGYAGFQNFLGKHVLLLSLWDLPDGTRPTIEYTTGEHHGDFGGEGEGKQVYTLYDWKVNTWYSMKIERLFESDKTYFTQYIKEENGEWTKTASISYPTEVELFEVTSLFQEDFAFNNLRRSCEIKNAGGLIAGTDTWEYWKSCEITNSFFPTRDATWENGAMENVSFDCNYKNNGDSIWIQSGGYDDTPSNITFPTTETLT